MRPSSARGAARATVAIALAVAATAVVWLVVARGSSPEDSGPLTISAAESEALVAERVGVAAARDPEVAHAPETADALATVTFGARLMDERAVGIRGAQLAWVELHPDRAPEERLAGAADGAGVVWLTLERAHLPDGDGPVTLRIAAPGRARVVLAVPPERWRAVQCNLGEIALLPGGDVEGRVVDDEGAPVAGARVALTEVRAFDDAERARRRVWDGAEPLAVPGAYPVAWTDADGRYRIEGAPLGRFALVADTGPARPDGARLPARSEPLEIRPGWTSVASELALVRPEIAELVTGTVLDARSAPLARAEVRLLAAGVEVDTAWSGPDGRFELLAFPGESLALVALDPASGWSAVLEGVRAGAADLLLRAEAAEAR